MALKSIITLVVASTVAVVGYTAVSPDEARAKTQVVADAATCHTLTGAAAGFYADNNMVAASVTDIKPYVSALAAVLAQYTVSAGAVTGPGCSVS